MNRSDFVARLKLTAPALAKREIMPILTHFLFDGKQVTAYNDEIGLRLPCQVPFMGMVRGDLLIDLLGSSKAKEIAFEPSETEVLIKAASARMTVPLATGGEELFAFPEIKKGTEVKDVTAFLDAVDLVLPFVGDNAVVPEQMGVTIQGDTKGVSFWATDGATIAEAACDVPVGVLRAILPVEFCRQLIALWKASKGGHLWISADFALAVLSHPLGAVEIYSRIIDCPQPIDIAGKVSDVLPRGFEKLVIDIPARMEMILTRAIIIGGQKNATMRVSARDDGKIEFVTKAEGRGEVRDVAAPETKHEPISVTLDPNDVKRGLPYCDLMLLTERCLVMTNSKTGFLYLVATKS